MSEIHTEQAREIYGTARLLQDRIIRLEAHGARVDGDVSFGKDLTFPQWNALKTVSECEQVTIKSLSAALQVSAPSASAMVERLVEMGMLVREQSTTDRREVLVRVTETGRVKIEEMDAIVLSTISDLMDKLTETEVQQWCALYRRVREIILSEANASPEDSGDGIVAEA